MDRCNNNEEAMPGSPDAEGRIAWMIDFVNISRMNPPTGQRRKEEEQFANYSSVIAEICK